MATVATITTPHAKYTVKRITADHVLKRYVTFIESPVEQGPLHRDPRELADCFELIAGSIAGAENALDVVAGIFAAGPRP